MRVTEADADRAYSILVEHAGAIESNDERADFIYSVSRPDLLTTEYRFGGSLGFGGKFRIPSDGRAPFVNCYPEDRTPERLEAIDRTNNALQALFAPQSSPAP